MEQLFGGTCREGAATPPTPPTGHTCPRSRTTVKSGHGCASQLCPAGGARPCPQASAVWLRAVSCWGVPSQCIHFGGVSAHSSQQGAEGFGAVFKAQLSSRSRQKGPFLGVQLGVCVGKVLECCYPNHVE